jgi:hypothetical protein
MSAFERVFRMALALLPREFRDRHGADVLQMAVGRVSEERGMARVARGVREVVDLVRHVPRLRRESASVVWHEEKSSMGDGLAADLRHAWRSLGRTRGFVTVAVGTLSAGIALTVTVTALFNAYLVRGLPYPESDRLY